MVVRGYGLNGVRGYGINDVRGYGLNDVRGYELNGVTYTCNTNEIYTVSFIGEREAHNL